ncbi:hypothetical protein DFH94DRAFT_712580 [Russula ochroleuca]|uniref:Uncharacterized protein n=1 Tax=Russula ochroleuca TaxID=152965 RepID=A0A9P5TDE6_9AGAM|nr:hypothetical protein DFH94DRAFT_712580 [Russula ochroleuca]
MSPQLLKLSGIGDPDVLQNADVEVVVDLRGVGNNVREHKFIGITYQMKEREMLYIWPTTPRHMAQVSVKEEFGSNFLT